MERKVNMDTQLQNFWKESITKEDLLRLCWLRRFKGDLSKPPARETKRKRVPTLPHIDVQTREAAVQEKEGSPSEEEKQKESIAEEQAPAVSLSDMRPVTPEVRALLYDGFSKEDKGRYLYLKARMKKGPSEKYEYPLTSSWNYGWKIAKVYSGNHTTFKNYFDDYLNHQGIEGYKPRAEDNVEYKKPGFGRSALVETAFYRRNGIFNKPEANDAMN